MAVEMMTTFIACYFLTFNTNYLRGFGFGRTRAQTTGLGEGNGLIYTDEMVQQEGNAD